MKSRRRIGRIKAISTMACPFWFLIFPIILLPSIMDLKGTPRLRSPPFLLYQHCQTAEKRIEPRTNQMKIEQGDQADARYRQYIFHHTLSLFVCRTAHESFNPQFHFFAFQIPGSVHYDEGVGVIADVMLSNKESSPGPRRFIPTIAINAIPPIISAYSTIPCPSSFLTNPTICAKYLIIFSSFELSR